MKWDKNRDNIIEMGIFHSASIQIASFNCFIKFQLLIIQKFYNSIDFDFIKTFVFELLELIL